MNSWAVARRAPLKSRLLTEPFEDYHARGQLKLLKPFWSAFMHGGNVQVRYPFENSRFIYRRTVRTYTCTQYSRQVRPVSAIYASVHGSSCFLASSLERIFLLLFLLLNVQPFPLLLLRSPHVCRPGLSGPGQDEGETGSRSRPWYPGSVNWGECELSSECSKRIHSGRVGMFNTICIGIVFMSSASSAPTVLLACTS